MTEENHSTLQAIRYVETEAHGFWEVRTETGDVRCPSLREFLKTPGLLELIILALEQPSVWHELSDVLPAEEREPAP